MQKVGKTLPWKTLSKTIKTLKLETVLNKGGSIKNYVKDIKIKLVQILKEVAEVDLVGKLKTVLLNLV